MTGDPNHDPNTSPMISHCWFYSANRQSSLNQWSRGLKWLNELCLALWWEIENWNPFVWRMLSTAKCYGLHFTNLLLLWSSYIMHTVSLTGFNFSLLHNTSYECFSYCCFIKIHLKLVYKEFCNESLTFYMIQHIRRRTTFIWTWVCVHDFNLS